MPRVKLEDHANAKQKIKELKTTFRSMNTDDKEYANTAFDLGDLYFTYPVIIQTSTHSNLNKQST